MSDVGELLSRIHLDPDPARVAENRRALLAIREEAKEQLAAVEQALQRNSDICRHGDRYSMSWCGGQPGGGCNTCGAKWTADVTQAGLASASK